MDCHLRHGIKESVDTLRQCIGRTIAQVEAIDYKCPVYGLRITFTDGAAIELQGEHDEGIMAALLPPAS